MCFGRDDITDAQKPSNVLQTIWSLALRNKHTEKENALSLTQCMRRAKNKTNVTEKQKLHDIRQCRWLIAQRVNYGELRSCQLPEKENHEI